MYSNCFHRRCIPVYIGLQGPQGVPGPQGATGSAGATGATGPATIMIGSTITGEPGTAASVTNVGNETDVVLQFTIPAGETGATGATGPVEFVPFHVYVLAGAEDGDGSEGSPFGTIEEGVAAVLNNGTVHILGGTYIVTSTITLNKVGITLQGYSNTFIEVQAAITPFIITGSGITISSLTITSDTAYPQPFIRITGSNHIVVDCNIYGPPQEGDSSTWVVNRGIITGSSTNIIIKDSIFHTVRQSAYLDNSTGYVINTIVYNTRGYVVDNSVFVFSGNSWGIPENAVDIALITTTPIGAPYDPLTSLSINNSNANISDQRS